MRLDSEFIKSLLKAFLESDETFITSLDLAKITGQENDGIISEKYLTHMHALCDKDLLVDSKGVAQFGFKRLGTGDILSDTAMRLTADGHEFYDLLNRKEVLETVKDELKNGNIRAVFDFGRSLVSGYLAVKARQYYEE